VIGLVDNDTVFRRFLDFCDDNGALVAVAAVELEELFEGVVADDIRVEDKEGRVVLLEDLLGELQGTGRVERFAFDGELDIDVVFFLILAVLGRPIL
jgi:hypothetical protein